MYNPTKTKPAEMAGFVLVRDAGIEPARRTWKVRVLPLNQSRYSVKTLSTQARTLRINDTPYSLRPLLRMVRCAVP